MIWYRHWIEMRRFFGILLLLMLPILALSVYNGARTPPRFPSRQAIEHLGEAAYPFWRAHAIAVGFAVVMVTQLTLGGGIRAANPSNGRELPSAALYNLTMPVTRRRLVCTRFAAAALLSLALFLTLFLMDSAIFAAMGKPVAWSAMALSSFAGYLLSLPAMAVCTVVVLRFGTFWGGFAGMMIVAILAVGLGMPQMARTPIADPWFIMAICLVLTAALLYAAIKTAEAQEF